jgi:hypothetical protein
MPSLAQATSKTIEQLGLKRGGNAPTPSQSILETLQDEGIQYTRCPVPPISISPDSLSSYGQKGLVPQARFMASLPLFQDSGESSTSVVKTTTVGGGSSSGAGSGTTTSLTLAPTNTGIKTDSISQGVPFLTSIQMAPLFLLYKVTVSSPARVELYSTSSAQNSDKGRLVSTPVSLGTENEIIGDFNLALSTESPWLCSPAPTGFNGDDPISSTIYLTVTNLNPSTVPIIVSLFYLPLGEA